jgi:hypothetical protein
MARSPGISQRIGFTSSRPLQALRSSWGVGLLSRSVVRSQDVRISSSRAVSSPMRESHRSQISTSWWSIWIARSKIQKRLDCFVPRNDRNKKKNRKDQKPSSAEVLRSMMSSSVSDSRILSSSHEYGWMSTVPMPSSRTSRMTLTS